jgi:hypothetical protein
MKFLAALGLALVVSGALQGCAANYHMTKAPTTPRQQLARAVEDGNEALVAKLLADGVEPGGDGMFDDGFGLAQYHGFKNILKMLVDRCTQIYVRGRNCPSFPGWVAASGDQEMLKAFLSSGHDVNELDAGDNSLLLYAASNGNMTNARILVARGADIDQAVQKIETSNAQLAAQNSAPANAAISKQNGVIAVLNGMRSKSPAAAAAPAAGGVSKAELAEMMKAAVAASQPAPAAKPAAAEFHSDVDAPAYKIAENPDAYALVVGVEKYNTLPEARFAERDARAMSAHLLAMGYPQRNIVLLTGVQATRTGLAKNLEAWLPNNVTERSTVFFYFSGHGAPDANTSQAYLVPADGDPQYLEETAYPMKRLYEKLAALKAKRVLVALDSCFSGAGGRSVLAQGTRPLVGKLQPPPTGRVVSLSASASDEVTGTAEDQGHGLFTYQLLKALTETAGRGTVAELYGALKPRVQDDARRQNRGQTPQLSGAAVDGGLR